VSSLRPSSTCTHHLSLSTPRVNIFSLVCRMIHKWKLWECVAYSWHGCTECGSARVRDSRHPRYSPRRPRMFDLMTVPFQPETASLRFPGDFDLFTPRRSRCRRMEAACEAPQVSFAVCACGRVYLTHIHTHTSYYVGFWLQLCARSKSKNKCRIDLAWRTNYTGFRESLLLVLTATTGAQPN
jgi:hypothetical protein